MQLASPPLSVDYSGPSGYALKQHEDQMSRHLRNPTIWVQPDLQSEKQARSLRFWIYDDFGFICVAKTKALINFAVTIKLFCAFVFASTSFWFSSAAAQIFTFLHLYMFMAQVS